MDPITTLTKQFSDFPGIGPRQARRFVYFLLRKDPAYLKTLSAEIEALKKSIATCTSCFQFFQKKNATAMLCSICANAHRNESQLMVVSHDVDLEHIEKSAVFQGRYFVLGGIVPILARDPDEKIRSRELIASVKSRVSKGVLKEIILAMNATPDGDNTGEYLIKTLSPLIEKSTVKISHLGRGISTGTEIEYSDKDTLKNALENRR